MAAQNRKLKKILLDIGGSNFETQCSEWQIVNDTDDAEVFHVYDPDESFAEAAEDAFKLEMKFFSDWRSGGISDFAWDHDGETVAFQLDHHPDIVGEHVRFTGQVQIKAPSVGGEVRTTEITEVSWACVGKPVKTRVG